MCFTRVKARWQAVQWRLALYPHASQRLCVGGIEADTQEPMAIYLHTIISDSMLLTRPGCKFVASLGLSCCPLDQRFVNGRGTLPAFTMAQKEFSGKDPALARCVKLKYDCQVFGGTYFCFLQDFPGPS